jgi:hypothetical protein
MGMTVVLTVVYQPSAGRFVSINLASRYKSKSSGTNVKAGETVTACNLRHSGYV